MENDEKAYCCAMKLLGLLYGLFGKIGFAIAIVLLASLVIIISAWLIGSLIVTIWALVALAAWPFGIRLIRGGLWVVICELLGFIIMGNCFDALIICIMVADYKKNPETRFNQAIKRLIIYLGRIILFAKQGKC